MRAGRRGGSQDLVMVKTDQDRKRTESHFALAEVTSTPLRPKVEAAFGPETPGSLPTIPLALWQWHY